MSKLLNDADCHVPEVRLELISVHVPKTAGASFRKVLATVYSEEGAYQPIYSKEEGVESIWSGGVPSIHPRTRAIHGHFPATPMLLKAFPHARVIAWIREPVARIISYYYYWRRTPRHGNPAHDEFLDLDLSLLDFAHHPAMRREMLQYFERVKLDDFFFVGLMERFDEDIRELARLLGWPQPQIPKANTAPERPRVSYNEIREIERTQEEAIDLYHRIKAMRGLAG